MKLGHKIAIGLLAGLILGFLINGMIGNEGTALTGKRLLLGAETIGELFLRLMKMIVVPLIFISITYSVANLGDMKKLRKIGVSTLVYFMLTTLLAVIVGIVLVNFIRPGVGAEVKIDQTALKAVTETGKKSIIDTLVHIVPDNIFQSLAKSEILQVVFFGSIFGAAVGVLKKRFDTLLHLLEELNDVIFLIVSWFLQIIPFVVCFMIAQTIGRTGITFIRPLAKYMATVLAGLAIHGLITLPLVLWLFARINPLTIIKDVSEAITTAFSTASSAATLPVTFKNCRDNLKVPRRIADFLLPIGATINMDGTALYEAVAAVFIAQAYGIHLSLEQIVIIMVTATLAAVGAAAIPQAGLFTMVVVLKTVGLPIEGIAMILAVDNILDMFRTAVNVEGDIVGCLVVTKMTDEAGAEPEPEPA